MNKLFKYERFNQAINQTIKESGLDVGAVYYILKCTLSEIENLYYAQLNKELMEQNSQEEKEENGTNS